MPLPRLVTPILAAVALTAAAGPAAATTISEANGVVTITDAPGANSRVEVGLTPTPHNLMTVDAGDATTAGAGCVVSPTYATLVYCPNAPSLQVKADLGDGDDHLRLVDEGLPGQRLDVTGGLGNDWIEGNENSKVAGTLDGGPGDDRLRLGGG